MARVSTRLERLERLIAATPDTNETTVIVLLPPNGRGDGRSGAKHWLRVARDGVRPTAQPVPSEGNDGSSQGP